jgi:hypothetical protein
MKSFLIISCSFFICLLAHAYNRRSLRKNTWIFFDLGNTLIDTKTHNYKPMFWMREHHAKDMYGKYKWHDDKKYTSARDYILDLKRKSFQLGMLTDIPEEWGINYPPENPVKDLATAKIVRLIDFLAGKVPSDKSSWKDGEEPWDYSPFGKFLGKNEDRIFRGSLFLPQKNTERKNKSSKVLFERGLAHARQNNKAQKIKALYIGEDMEELQLAEDSGMIPFQVGVTSKKYFYPPAEKIDWYVKNYQKGLWRGLGNQDFP